MFGVAFSLFWSGLLGVGVGRTGLSSGSQPGRIGASEPTLRRCLVRLQLEASKGSAPRQKVWGFRQKVLSQS